MATLAEIRSALRAQVATISPPTTKGDRQRIRACRRKLYDLRDDQDIEKARQLAVQELRDFGSNTSLLTMKEAWDSLAILLAGVRPYSAAELATPTTDPEEQARRDHFTRTRAALKRFTEIDPLTVAEEDRSAFVALQMSAHERRENKLGSAPLPGSPQLAKNAAIVAALAALNGPEMSASELAAALALL